MTQERRTYELSDVAYRDDTQIILNDGTVIPVSPAAEQPNLMPTSEEVEAVAPLLAPLLSSIDSLVADLGSSFAGYASQKSEFKRQLTVPFNRDALKSQSRPQVVMTWAILGYIQRNTDLVELCSAHGFEFSFSLGLGDSAMTLNFTFVPPRTAH